MFWLILGHGTPIQAVPLEGSGQERVEANANRRHPASTSGLAGAGVAAPRWGDERPQSIPDGAVRGAGDPDDRQTVSTGRPGTGLVREKASGARGTTEGIRQATNHRHGL